jgi:N-dimethylarginine dimethylaminohydrolase
VEAKPHGRVLMCPPTYFVVRDVKNPFMDVGRPVDLERAKAQWVALESAFRAAGLETLHIEPVADLEDMVFAANQAFAGSDSDGTRFVVPSRMRYASREREVPYYVDWFRGQGYEICDVGLDGEFLEGHGDLLHHSSGGRVWAGHGFRSSRGGVERFSNAMKARGIDVTALELADPSFYHLDTCLAPLNAEAALLYPGAFSAESLGALRRGFARLYEVSREDALRFVCNGVVANQTFVASYVPESVRSALAAEMLAPVLVDLSEFEKAGGSAFCLKTFL